jgi:hypothetical protein
MNFCQGQWFNWENLRGQVYLLFICSLTMGSRLPVFALNIEFQ